MHIQEVNQIDMCVTHYDSQNSELSMEKKQHSRRLITEVFPVL